MPQGESRIAGHVVDEHGQPIAHAHVSALWLSGRRAPPLEVTADRNGHFDFFAVDPGEHLVRATSPGQRFESGRSGDSEGQVVSSGTMDLTLVLANGAVVTGRVLFDDKPMPYYGISLCQRDIPLSGGSTAIRDATGFTLRTWSRNMAARL